MLELKILRRACWSRWVSRPSGFACFSAPVFFHVVRYYFTGDLSFLFLRAGCLGAIEFIKGLNAIFMDHKTRVLGD